MVGYKLSKNDWVTPFFVIFRSVREKLLVTVSFDHPVPSVALLPASVPPSRHKQSKVVTESWTIAKGYCIAGEFRILRIWPQFSGRGYFL